MDQAEGPHGQHPTANTQKLKLLGFTTQVGFGKHFTPRAEGKRKKPTKPFPLEPISPMFSAVTPQEKRKFS